MKKLKTLFIFICCACAFAVFGCENKNQTSLYAPAIVSVDAGNIVFMPVNNAQYYVVNINNKEYYIDINNNNIKIIDNQIHYNASKLFSKGQSYSIKMKAIANGMADSAYTVPISYTHLGDKPEISEVQINGKSLTWNSNQDVSYFSVKVKTPKDVLTSTDADSVESSDLSEYVFNNNVFDFSSMLDKAGEYLFFIKAVQDTNGNLNTSGYNAWIKYDFVLDLTAPSSVAVSKQGEEVHLTAVVDANSNAISITCGNYSKMVELNGSNIYVEQQNNILDINLTGLMATGEGEGDFIKNYQHFTFAVQSHYLVASGKSYYKSSAVVGGINFDHTCQLEAPVLSVSGNMASWTVSEPSKVNAYKLVVVTDAVVDPVSVVDIQANKTSYELPANCVAVGIQSIGVGNYLNSNLSEFVSLAGNADMGHVYLDYRTSDNMLECSYVSGAIYFYEVDNKFVYSDSNNLELFKAGEKAKVTIVASGCAPKTAEYKLVQKTQLATPSISFDDHNNYLLKIDEVDNAIGYYVYLRTGMQAQGTKIDKLFVDRTIDLSKYISTTGDYNSYAVSVEAVAGKYDNYLNSNASSEINITHAKKLSKPVPNRADGVDMPVIKTQSGDDTSYKLVFYGVEGASRYEIYINYNQHTVYADGRSTPYEIDISEWLIGPNKYSIKIRSVANSVLTYSSDYYEYDYYITKQLDTVKDIEVIESEGKYHLTFDSVDNASAYEIKIVKFNDAGYDEYLATLGLTSRFNISLEESENFDLADYVVEQGEYFIYMRAIATPGGMWVDSAESSDFGQVLKLIPLSVPTNIVLNNLSASEFNLSWTGDSNAEYYAVSIMDANGVVYTTIETANTNINVNDYMTVEGDYTFVIRSMCASSSRVYKPSEYASYVYNYQYQTEKDFTRHELEFKGEKFDFALTDASELKTLLWYNLVFNAGETRLPILVQNATNAFDLTEGNNETFVRWVAELTESGIHDFSMDTQWQLIIDSIEYEIQDLNTENDSNWVVYLGSIKYAQGLQHYFVDEYKDSLKNFLTTFATAKMDGELVTNKMFKLIVERVLEAYPELKVLSEVEIEQNGQIYRLNYKNELDGTKVYNASSTTIKSINNGYQYLNESSQRGQNCSFAIDAKDGVFVANSEQLLEVVMSGKKPIFANSSVAETVYVNAKAVLRRIVNDRMSETEKVEAIFNWLEYALNFDPNSMKKVDGAIKDAGIETYGLYNEFYLESVFENINNSIVAGKDKYFYLGNKYATSESYSKAFSLLCAIEGIDTRIVRMDYSYGATTYRHAFNKVYVKNDLGRSYWYVCDVMLSDNQLNYSNLFSSVSAPTHTFFMLSENEYKAQLNRLGLTVYDSGEGSSGEYNNFYPNLAVECITESSYYKNKNIQVSAESLNKVFGAGKYTSAKTLNLAYNKADNLKDYLYYTFASLEEGYIKNSGKTVLEFKYPVLNDGFSVSEIIDYFAEVKTNLSYNLQEGNVSFVRTNNAIIVVYVLG